MNNNFMKALRNFSRIFVGFIFIFSGFVKVIDPIGYAYKFMEYFEAMHLTFFADGSLVFAILMSIAELVLGIALTFNLLPKISAWAALLFMTFFTPLTLWLAVANPVSDCGCFGDALILTNWETFFKNVIIDVFVVIIFVNRKKYKPAYISLFQWMLGICFAIASYILAIYCLRNLPIIDFRPYHIGANIMEGMSVPESEKNNVDIIESYFIYEKDGVQETFDITSIPDSTWKFVNARHKIIKEGYKPPIHDFTVEPVFVEGHSQSQQNDYINLFDYTFEFVSDEESNTFSIDELPDNSWEFISVIPNDIDPALINIFYLTPDGETETFSITNLPSEDYVFLDAIYENINTNFKFNYGEDIAPQILTSENYAFFLVTTYLEEFNTKYLDKINDIAMFCEEKGYDFYCLTGSGGSKIKEFADKHNPIFNFYNTDPTTLKTIIRSNPGLVLTYKGTILDKWADRNIPSIDNLKSDLMANSITKHQKNNETNINYMYILALLMFMSLFHALYLKLKHKNFINN
jgi:uncharacterized membrane protein YphA (DoxX/SURF4 family)